jgi:hypothetical protein
MTASGPDKAVANARSFTTYAVGYCQQFTRVSWEVGPGYGSAIEAWNGARHKHPGDRNPPPGAPTYYRGGKYGHAVVSVGGGRIRSTDCTRPGVVSENALNWPENTWNYEYLGWTEDINGVDLPGLRPEPEPGEDGEVNLNDEIANWSPDDGSDGKMTVGQTLNQARGYSEDAYQRVKTLEAQVREIGAQVDRLVRALT